MNDENTFQHYRAHLDRAASYMCTIHKAVSAIADMKVFIPERVMNAAVESIHNDSTSIEENMINEIREWYHKHNARLPLFDEEGMTLAIMSDIGHPQQSVICRNTGWSWHNIKTFASKYSEFNVEPPKSISFDGFRPDEIKRILYTEKTVAENAVEHLRDIQTILRHIMFIQLPLNTGWVSSCDVSPVQVFSDKWLSHTMSDADVSMILDPLSTIDALSTPPNNEPAVLRVFSSHRTNRINLDTMELYSNVRVN